MFKINEYLIYHKETCKIINIKNDNYVLKPLNDTSLKITIPINNGNIRNIMTKKEITELIEKIPTIKMLDITKRNIENDYKKLLQSDNEEDLVKIIKTSYTRNKIRKENNKKLGDKDQRYFDLAENYLYNEISAVLNINYEDAKEYVIKEVNNLC